MGIGLYVDANRRAIQVGPPLSADVFFKMLRFVEPVHPGRPILQPSRQTFFNRSNAQRLLQLHHSSGDAPPSLLKRFWGPSLNIVCL
eukprot:2947459-Rhodomonas_salina.2